MVCASEDLYWPKKKEETVLTIKLGKKNASPKSRPRSKKSLISSLSINIDDSNGYRTGNNISMYILASLL